MHRCIPPLSPPLRHLPCCSQASAFVMFPDIQQACQAVLALKRTGAASAVELFDWRSLK